MKQFKFFLYITQQYMETKRNGLIYSKSLLKKDVSFSYQRHIDFFFSQV